jgi:RNA polymerase sigma-70 factor (ECF subfamily)
MDAKTYLSLLRCARRRSRLADEAGDLLQSALLAAIEAQRGDMTRSENRRWLVGVLRNRALHEARSAARRRQRESAYMLRNTAEEEALAEEVEPFVTTLPPSPPHNGAARLHRAYKARDRLASKLVRCRFA